MPNIREIRTVHSGFVGGPGYTQLYFDANGTADDQVDSVHAFWDTVAPQMAGTWRYTIDSAAKVLDDSTGALVDINPITPAAQGVFGAAGAYAGGTGACASWYTGAVHLGRPLRGRTFLVPLNGGAYESDGTLNSIALTNLRDAATALVADPDFGVWGRPVDGLNGLFALASASNVRDQTATLRSRRT